MADKITVDKIIGHDLYSKGNNNGYAGDFVRVNKHFSDGEKIGNVYSWLERNGDIWYMVYSSDYDFANYNPTYVKHVDGSLSLPDLPDILAQIEAKKAEDEKEKKGLIPYYIEKYLPWIVGGIVVAVAAPSIINASQKKIGMTSDQKNLAGLAAVGVAVYFLTRKKTNPVPITSIDNGSFGPGGSTSPGVPIINPLPVPINYVHPPHTGGGTNNGNGTGVPVLSTDSGSGNTGNNHLTNDIFSIDFVGPYEVSYKNNAVSGHHNLGLIRVN